MMSSKAASKPRVQRLRASCDGCFLAKVKCSKARPVCSRCLTCGTDCKYSPSSRAGKPKSSRPGYNSNLVVNINSQSKSLLGSALSLPCLFDPQVASIGGKGCTTASFNPTWAFPTGLDGELFPGSSPMTTVPSTNGDNAFNPLDMGLPLSAYDYQMWMPPMQNDLGPFPMGVSLPRSRLMGDVNRMQSFTPWLDDQQTVRSSPLTSSTNLTPDVFSTPSTSPESSSGFIKPPTSSCNCFTTCLQSLQALHNQPTSAFTQSSFDSLLNMNKKALESCSSMLSCGNCSSKFGRMGSNTNAMVLTTIMEKIIFLYQAAVQENVASAAISQSQKSVVSPQSSQDGSWLRAEALWRELRNLEELLSHFREILGASDDCGVHVSLLSYLNHSLSFTFEMLKVQQTR